MGLINRAADGPTYSGRTDLQSRGNAGVTNQYLPEAAVARMLLSRWVNKASLIDITKRKLSSEFMGGGTPIGDTINVPIRDRHRVTKGINFQAQARQARWTTMSLFEPQGIHSEENMWNTPLYADPEIERQRYEDKVDRFISEVETTIGDEMRAGYWYGIQPLNVQTAATTLAAAGIDSTTHPNGKVLHRTMAAMEMRGINRGMPCAMLDPETNASLTEAIEQVPYNPGAMAGEAYGKGKISGGKFGWELKRSVHNGVISYRGLTQGMQTNGATVPAGQTQNAGTIVIDTLGADQIFPGVKLEFHRVRGVNEETGANVQRRASFAVTEETTGGGSKTVKVSPGFLFAAADTEDGRRRTCSQQPGDNAKVYPMGVDISTPANFGAMGGGKSVLASFLVARDTTYSCMVDPDLPTRDAEQAIRVRNRSYKVNFWLIRFFDGNTVSYRDRIDGRWGVKVVEPEGGYVLGGTPEAA